MHRHALYGKMMLFLVIIYCNDIYDLHHQGFRYPHAIIIRYSVAAVALARLLRCA